MTEIYSKVFKRLLRDDAHEMNSLVMFHLPTSNFQTYASEIVRKSFFALHLTPWLP